MSACIYVYTWMVWWRMHILIDIDKEKVLNELSTRCVVEDLLMRYKDRFSMVQMLCYESHIRDRDVEIDDSFQDKTMIPLRLNRRFL